MCWPCFGQLLAASPLFLRKSIACGPLKLVSGTGTPSASFPFSKLKVAKLAVVVGKSGVRGGKPGCVGRRKSGPLLPLTANGDLYELCAENDPTALGGLISTANRLAELLDPLPNTPIQWIFKRDLFLED